MSFFTSLLILLLAMLIQSFLQLTPGVFAIFYHSALANFSRKKADDLSLAFILGQELLTALIFLSAFSLAAFSFQDPNVFTDTILPWALCGIFAAEAIFACFGYYRPGSRTKVGTELFISRRFSTNLTAHARHAKTRADAAVLGIVSTALELPLTLPLYVIMSLFIINLTAISSNLIIILYIVIATLPLFAIRQFFTTGHGLAAAIRFRLRLKPFVRIILPLGFLLIAILIAINKVFL